MRDESKHFAEKSTNIMSKSALLPSTSDDEGKESRLLH